MHRLRLVDGIFNAPMENTPQQHKLMLLLRNTTQQQEIMRGTSQQQMAPEHQTQHHCKTQQVVMYGYILLALKLSEPPIHS